MSLQGIAYAMQRLGYLLERNQRLIDSIRAGSTTCLVLVWPVPKYSEKAHSACLNQSDQKLREQTGLDERKL